MAACGFALVPCPKQCKDDNDAVMSLLKKDLEEHLRTDCPSRDHKCEHCGKKSPHAFITQVHDGKCRKKVIPCPNAGCGDTMERQQVRKHFRTKCLYAVIPCKYKGLRCDTELKREDMAAHEQDNKHHLHMALKTVNSQQSAIDSLQAMVKSLFTKLELQEKVLKNKESKTFRSFRLSEYGKKKETNKVFHFPPFYTHPNGYHMALRVDANGYGDGKGTHVSVSAVISEGEYDTGLKWPFVGKVTVTLLNQLQDMNHHSLVIPFNATDNRNVGDALGFSTYIAHSTLSLQYLQDDALYFRVSVEVTDYKPWLE